jgi:dipeptidyl aminopeptidase/acylaminoacyl peptidase
VILRNVTSSGAIPGALDLGGGNQAKGIRASVIVAQQVGLVQFLNQRAHAGALEFNSRESGIDDNVKYPICERVDAYLCEADLLEGLHLGEVLLASHKAASGKPLGDPMMHKDYVYSAQFSPDGQRVMTASLDATARLWDAASSKPIDNPMRHQDSVTSAQFSPDGRQVVTASGNTARLWDPINGKPIGEPMLHEKLVTTVQFSPDGKKVVTASQDKTARLWDAAIVPDKDTTEDILLLVELAEATGGVALETVGQGEILNVLTLEQKEGTREKIAAKYAGMSSGLTPLQRFLRWSVSDRRNRTISALSQETVSEWLENRIKEGRVEGLRDAMQVDPSNAPVTAHLGRRLADQAVKQGSDTDEGRRAEARRARAEADFLTSRAQKLAPNNDEVKKLRDEVVKLLGLKTN